MEVTNNEITQTASYQQGRIVSLLSEKNLATLAAILMLFLEPSVYKVFYRLTNLMVVGAHEAHSKHTLKSKKNAWLST